MEPYLLKGVDDDLHEPYSGLCTDHVEIHQNSQMAAYNGLKNRPMCTFSTICLLEIAVVPLIPMGTFELQNMAVAPKFRLCTLCVNILALHRTPLRTLEAIAGVTMNNYTVHNSIQMRNINNSLLQLPNDQSVYIIYSTLCAS